ncbi:MAG: tetratricopeptide repeat protein [Candidatus Dactylopiibacterium sp.]|nr:tetratricopeptide repeat protein [Candidatus Dactylopiibacterium sp.]
MSRKVEELSVLIVDANPAMRSQLRNMLAMSGISKIAHVVTAGAAVRRLREHSPDLILCEYHLGEGQDGQHLLEDLRGNNLIPLSTLFLMITGERQQEKVISAAELAPNDYILKPFSAEKLLGRISRALLKRDVFRPIYRHIELGNPIEAIRACQAGEQEHPEYLIDFLRMRAELHVAAGQPEEAEAIYQRVLESRAVPWARLGLARTLYMQKRHAESEEILEDLLRENANYLDAYDWLARTRQAMGNVEEAKRTLENAVRVSPHTVRRLRELGEVSAATGDMETAARVLGTVVNKNKYSDFRNPEDHVLLIKAQLGAGDEAGATATLRDLERSMENVAGTALCSAIGETLLAAHQGDAGRAGAALSEALRMHVPEDASSAALRKDLARLCIAQNREDEAATLVMEIMRHAADDTAVEELKNMMAELGHADLGHQLAEHVRSEVRHIMSEGAQLAQSGDYEGAVRQMLDAAKRLPGNTNVAFNAALALLKHIEHRGWNAEFATSARHHIERVRRQDPSNPRLAALLGFYHQLSQSHGGEGAGGNERPAA